MALAGCAGLFCAGRQRFSGIPVYSVIKWELTVLLWYVQDRIGYIVHYRVVPAFVLQHVEGAKIVMIIALAWLAGEASEAVAHNPAVTGGIIGGAVALLIKLLDVWYENRKNQRESQQKEHATADKVLELEQKDKEQLREEFKRLSQEKETFYKAQCDRLRAEVFEVRTTNHLMVNELMRLYHLILGLQEKMIKGGLEVPEITFVPLTKFIIANTDDDTDEHLKAKDIVAKSGHGD